MPFLTWVRNDILYLLIFFGERQKNGLLAQPPIYLLTLSFRPAAADAGSKNTFLCSGGEQSLYKNYPLTWGMRMLSPRAKTLCPSRPPPHLIFPLHDGHEGVVNGVVAREGGGGISIFDRSRWGLREKCFSHGGEETQAEWVLNCNEWVQAIFIHTKQ